MSSVYHTAYRNSKYSLPEQPEIKTVQVWDEVFTHQSLPNNNGVVSVLGRSILSYIRCLQYSWSYIQPTFPSLAPVSQNG